MLKNLINKKLLENYIVLNNGAAELDVTGCQTISFELVNSVAADTGIDSPESAVLVDQNVTYTAQEAGPEGNDITITLIDPGGTEALDIEVTGNAIVVTLQTSAGNIVTDEDALVAAINGDPAANALVQASGTGSNPLAALTETPLAGGSNNNIDVASSTFNVTGHGLYTGMVGQLTTNGTLPAPLLTSTNYYVIRLNANQFRLAASLEDAQNGVFVELEDGGSDGAENDFDVASVSGASVKLQKSNTGAVWLDEGNAVNITTSGGIGLAKVDPEYKLYRLLFAISAGQVVVNCTVIGKGYDN